ncbi:hypothetical protein RSOLAG22IIIB_13999 [Rhizoctonia solani]|uniref:Uncharacterized protein n=1 Tax=Rhizoctonia solani TaxID=456999 RepID=A0A0K6FT86_9AGAM|nr:hypothetical protein RSOLAG22IIIB_13999 [Rhizoctonia solani]
MLLLQLFAIIAACPYMVVAPRPPRGGASTSNSGPSVPIECPEGEWYWAAKNVCLPKGMPANPDPVPFGNQCPPYWYWHQNGYCAPSRIQHINKKCRPEYGRDPVGIWCEPRRSCKCDQHEWRWKARNICLLRQGPPIEHIGPIPDGYKCPREWYWHRILQHCVPISPEQQRQFCPPGYERISFRCEPLRTIAAHRAAPIQTTLPIPTALNACPEGEWYWEAARKCIPLGGLDTAPPARLGFACPEGWYWHLNHHCAPRRPENLGAPCPDGYKWDGAVFVCEPVGDSDVWN